MEIITTFGVLAAVIFAAIMAAIVSVRDRSEEPLPSVLFDTRPPEGTVPSTVQSTVPGTVPDAPVAPTLSWEEPKGAFKLTRIMCDEERLTVAQKNIVCACLWQESNFLNRYLSDDPKGRWKKGDPVKNENVKNGKVWSVDWGIAQVNDTPGWHIGPGLRFKSVDDVLANPEKAVRWMVQTMKKTGKLQPWSSYTSGAYKAHLVPTSPMWKLRS